MRFCEGLWGPPDLADTADPPGPASWTTWGPPFPGWLQRSGNRVCLPGAQLSPVKCLLLPGTSSSVAREMTPQPMMSAGVTLTQLWEKRHQQFEGLWGGQELFCLRRRLPWIQHGAVG